MLQEKDDEALCQGGSSRDGSGETYDHPGLGNGGEGVED